MKWQPIETVPEGIKRNGTEIFLRNKGGRIGFGRFVRKTVSWSDVIHKDKALWRPRGTGVFEGWMAGGVPIEAVEWMAPSQAPPEPAGAPGDLAPLEPTEPVLTPSERTKRWRADNRDRYNEYMRNYRKERRDV